MLTIKTANGVIQFSQAFIRASKHPSEENIYYHVRLMGKLPGGRKFHVLTHSYGPDTIHLQKLYGYAKWHSIEADKYKEFLDSLPVKSCTIFPVEVTEDIVAGARKYCAEMCSCNAVKNPM